METERMEHLLDRIESVKVTDVVDLPEEEFERRLRIVGDAHRELLTGITDQIIGQSRR